MTRLRLLSRPGCVNSFEQLSRELYIPAIHLDTGDKVLFGTPGWRDVPISDAIAASSALPLYFQPVCLKGLDFVDGGTKVALNGEARGMIPGVAFNNALTRIWLGDKPAEKDLKKAMLGG